MCTALRSTKFPTSHFFEKVVFSKIVFYANLENGAIFTKLGMRAPFIYP